MAGSAETLVIKKNGRVMCHWPSEGEVLSNAKKDGLEDFTTWTTHAVKKIAETSDDYHRAERKMLQGEISASEASEKESMAKMEALLSVNRVGGRSRQYDSSDSQTPSPRKRKRACVTPRRSPRFLKHCGSLEVQPITNTPSPSTRTPQAARRRLNLQATSEF
ncbi:uncharacterized protein LOC108683111 isoform X2 [Hyalella azteca]|uniref:Uncharacterized protein LOC108683111 isoform X2 n=1 Tax=Hyalella azteca TaxID=294128 RepID=A0A979FKP4_HYAAZ|nr:uncharacterized protein LOC108683111 isoform X2 [Hyalella azteca]